MVRICCIRISQSFTGFGNMCLLHFGNTKKLYDQVTEMPKPPTDTLSITAF